MLASRRFGVVSLLLAALVGIAFAGGCASVNVGAVQLTVDNFLVHRGLPVITYECVRGGQAILASAYGVGLVEINTSLLETNGYLAARAEEIHRAIRHEVTGLVDEYNTNRATKTFINSANVANLVLQYRMDHANIFPEENPDGLHGARINGPLAGQQATSDLTHTNSQLSGWEAYSADPLYLKNGFFSLWDRNGTRRCSIQWSVASTTARKLYAAKRPDLFNLTLVGAMTHWDLLNDTKAPGVSYGGGFGPAVQYGDMWLLSDATPSNRFLTDNYFKGIVDPRWPTLTGFQQAADGSGPLIPEHWGVNRQNRHFLNGYVMGINSNCEVVFADRFADMATGARTDQRTYRGDSSQGMVYPWAGGRQGQAFKYQGREFYVLPVTSLDDLRTEYYQETDVDLARAANGTKNNNIHRHYGKLVVFELLREAQTNALVDIAKYGQIYTGPDWLFAGMENPFKPGTYFANDTEAFHYNYHVDGFWHKGILVLLEKGLIIHGGANQKDGPVEEILACMNGVGTFDPVTGGQGYPQRSYYEWRRLYANTTSQREHDAVYYDMLQTQVDCQREIEALSPRGAKNLGNTVHAFDILTGETRWAYHYWPKDRWQSLYFQQADPEHASDYIKAQFLFEGSDRDLGIAPMYHARSNTVVAVFKDSGVLFLDADTGARKGALKIALETVAGVCNYGAVMIDDYVFVTVNNNDFLGGLWGPLSYEATFDPVAQKPVIEARDPAADGLLDKPYYTEHSLDPSGPRKRSFDARSLLLARVHVPSQKVTGIIVLHAPEKARPTLYAPFAVPVSGANDLVFTPTGYGGEVWAVDVNTMEKRWSFDLFQDLKNTTPTFPANRDFLFVNNAPFIDGDQMCIPASDNAFQGPSQGRYNTCFQLQDPVAAQKKRAVYLTLEDPQVQSVPERG